MKNTKLHLLFIFIVSLSSMHAFASDFTKDLVANQLEKYNVLWNTQSLNSSESMPLGGGDIGLNVWMENGDILFYLSRSGTFDENNQFLKLGRVRIQMKPNIFLENDCQFSQELKLHDGYVQIKGKKRGKEVTVNLWVNVFKPVVNVDINSSFALKVTGIYENWRTAERLVPQLERNACFSYSGYPGDVVTDPDTIEYKDQGILWFHRNNPDKLLFDFCVKQQGLTPVKDQMINTQKDLTFGGYMFGEGMKPSASGTGKYVDTPFSYWSVTSVKALKKQMLNIILYVDQTESIVKWKTDLFAVASSSFSRGDWAKTKEWWHSYWNRSFIFINATKNDPTDKGWQVGRNYQLFRYMLGCNAYGAYPSKFNGGLFTFDPVFVKQFAETNHGTPDYRSWGGGSFTAQNQRLVYWPMLKSGDFDMMHSQFNFYKRALKNAELRSKVYWGHAGCCFTEQVENFGLPFAGGWGFESGVRKRDPATPFGEQTNPYVKHHYTTQLEFAYMILKYYQYTGNDISEYMSFIESSVNFFFEHYAWRNQKSAGQPYDENGKLVIFPSTAAETYKNIKNPTDLCSALKAVVMAISELPDTYISAQEKNNWKEKLQRIPDLTYANIKGKRILVPGNDLPKPINQEIMELYPLFPYEQFGIGKPDLQTVIDTWKYGTFTRNYISWHQDGIFCARMGLTNEAKKIAILKLQDGNLRFPAFWGPGHDYVPDHNWGGSGMIGLQDMLLQFEGDNIHAFPAWPKDWDVQFKLHAPSNIQVIGTQNNGVVIRLNTSDSEGGEKGNRYNFLYK